MPYYHTDQKREKDPGALPDVEVFIASYEDCAGDNHLKHNADEPCPYELGVGWYYAHGTPGCLWESDPVGPFETEAEALKEAREAAGFCEHGVSDEDICEECPAPELWVLRQTTALSERYLIHTTTPDATQASAWASKGDARRCLVRNGTHVHGFEPVRLSDADARRWGKGE